MGQELSSTDASGPLASVRLFLDAFQQFGEKQEKGTTGSKSMGIATIPFSMIQLQ